MSVKYYVGAVFSTKNWGDVEIVEILEKRGSNTKLMIKFLNTGNIKKSSSDALKEGTPIDTKESQRLQKEFKKSEEGKRMESIRDARRNVRDRLSRLGLSIEEVCGMEFYNESLGRSYRIIDIDVDTNSCSVVNTDCGTVTKGRKFTAALIGKVLVEKEENYSLLDHLKDNPEDGKAFSVRLGIIRRCYNKSDNSYSEYGGRGVRMCDEWKDDALSFAQWYTPRYLKIKDKWDLIDIDKDLLGDSMLYSPDTCLLIPTQMNGAATRLDEITSNGLPVGVEYHPDIDRYRARWRQFNVTTRERKRNIKQLKTAWEAVSFYAEARIKAWRGMVDQFHEIGVIDDFTRDVAYELEMPEHYFDEDRWREHDRDKG